MTHEPGQAAPTSRFRGRLGPLADHDFRFLWLAATTSAVGSAFVPVALAFAVLDTGGSATSLGLVLLVSSVAGLASYQIAGVWADRMSRRNLMLAADVLRMLTEAAIAAVLLTGNSRIWMLAVAAVLTSIGTAFEGPASTSLVAEILPPGRLQQANSLLSISTSGSSVVGPALSGLLVATAGPGWAFAVDAASFAGSAIFLLMMPPRGRPPAERGRFFSELAAGWRQVTARTWVWLNLATFAVTNMAFAVFLVLGPVVAKSRLGGAASWGLISTGFAVGALAGGVAAMWIKARRTLVVGNLALLAGVLTPLAIAARLPLLVITVAAVVNMAGFIVLNMAWDTAIQQLIPNDVLARVRSYDYLLAFVAMPVGYAIAGPLSAAFGADKVLVAAAIVIGAAALTAAAMPAIWAIVRHKDGTITGPAPKSTTDP